MPTLMTPTMLSVPEVREKTGLPERVVRQLCKDKKIVHIVIGRKFLINWEKFVEYLNTGEQEETV